MKYTQNSFAAYLAPIVGLSPEGVRTVLKKLDKRGDFSPIERSGYRQPSYYDETQIEKAKELFQNRKIKKTSNATAKRGAKVLSLFGDTVPAAKESSSVDAPTDNTVDIGEDDEKDDDTFADLPVFIPADDDMEDDDELIDPPADAAPADVPIKVVDKQKRIDEAKKFFDVLFGKIPVAQFSYVLNFKGYWDSFEIADENQRAEMARKAVENSDKGFNIWHAVNPVSVKPHYEFDEVKQKKVFKRGDEAVVSYQTAVVVDIDIRSEAHKGESSKLAADFAEAKSFLPFPSSLLIDSGYGLHAYYIFDTPLVITDDNREEIKRRNKLLLDVIRAKANGKMIDAVEDLPRILRTPGTFNYKLGKDNAPMCHVVEVNDIRFTPADLDERLNAFAPQLIAPPEPARATDTKNPAATKFELPLDDSPELKAFRIRHMLPYISVTKGEYDKWLDVGIALFNEGMNCADWENWSRTQPEFKEGECESKWEGFSYRSDGIKIGTLYQWAMEGGYNEKETQREFYELHPELSKKKSTSAQIEQLKAELRDVAQKLADFDAQRDAALERLRNVETFDSDTVLADDVIEAAAFAKNYDIQALAAFKRAVKNYGKQHKDTVVNANDFRDCVKDKAEELEARRGTLAARSNDLQAQINSLSFLADNDEMRGVKIPDGYEVARNGIQLVAGEKLIPVARLPVIIKSKSFAVDDEDYKLILSYRDENGKWRRLPAQEVATVSDRNKIVALSNKGLPVTSSTAKLLVDYLDAFRKENEIKLPLTYTFPRCGWQEFNGDEYFIDPRRSNVVTEDSKEISVVVDKCSQFAKALHAKGSLEEWKRAYELAKKSPVARLMVAASIAPPLLKFLGERNFLLYVYAPTRAGKTSALCLGGSAVGSEKTIRSFDATKNGLAGAAADVSDFPFIVDEKQVADNRLKEQLDNLVYSLANGVGRTKMNKDSTLKDVKMWRTIAIMTGETQMLADNVTGGANTRLMTIAAPKTILPADTCKEIRDIIADNYGLAFPLVINKIIAAGKTKLRATYQQNVELFTEKFSKVLPEYRRYLAVLTLADALLNSVLGIADANEAYDDAVANATKIFALIPTMEEISDTTKEKAFVSGFCAQNQNRFVGGSVTLDRMQAVYGKLRDDDGFNYITAKALRDACKAEGIDYHKLVADLVAVGFFVPSDKVKKGRKKPSNTVQKKIGTENTDCYRFKWQSVADDDDE